MKTHLEFRSAGFQPYPGEVDEMNPGRFGKRLAEFLVHALAAAGFHAEEPAAEDWGWNISIRNDSFPLSVGCGNYEEYPDGFLCFITPSQPFVRKWFRKVPTEAIVAKVANVLETSLRKHPDVRDLRWSADMGVDA
jgi:hypothetical protein